MAGLNGRLPSARFWHGRRVLLTGHTGFKGAWLTLWLRRLGADVTGLSLPAETGSLGALLGVERLVPSHAVDLRDHVRLRDAVRASAPEVVIHMAAQALVRAGYADPLGTVAVNALGTAAVLDALRDLPGVRAAVIVTTDKCYQNREWPYPYRETDALGGHDPYSASKAAAELLTAAWRASFLSDGGVAVATARAGNVIGGGDWAVDRLLPDCIRAFAAATPVLLRNPAATRPWQHVLEPLAGYLLLAEALCTDPAPFAQAWNFGPSPDGIAPVGEVVAAAAAAWGPGAAWSADPGPHPHEAGLLALESSAARHRLGWAPRWNLTRAIETTVAWYRHHGSGADAQALIETDLDRYTECPA